MSITPRPYQMTIIDQTREALRRSQAVMINLATGGGKTAIAAYIAKGVSDRGKRIWFGAHREELLTQTSLTFQRADIDHGFIAAGYRPQPFTPVQIASIHTLVRRLDRYDPPHILFVDEAKRSVAPTYRKIIEHCLTAGSKVIGLDATPWRLNGEGFRTMTGADGHERPMYQEMVKGPPPSWLMANGWLSRYVAYSVPGVNRDAMRIRMGEFAVEDAEREMSKPSVTGDTIKTWMEKARGKKTIMFDVSVRESVEMVAQFNAAGVRAMHIDGETADEERRSVARRLAMGEIDILSNVDLLSDGYDLAAAAGMDVSIEAGIFRRPTTSLALWYQQVGRVLRPKDQPAILLDHAGNIMAMKRMFGVGLPDNDYDWSLDPWDRKAAKKKAESSVKIDVRQCPACYFVHGGGAKACPNCGHVYGGGGRQVEQRDGELEAVDPILLQHEKDMQKAARLAEEQACSSLRDWQDLAKQRGHKSGWAWMRWNARKQRHSATQEAAE